MMMNPPDLSNVILPFDPVSFWQPGEYDPAQLIDALKAQTGLEDFDDELSNRQAAVRLDLDADETNVGFWVTVPKGTAQSVVDAGMAAYAPLPPPPPDDPLIPASVAVETAVAAVMATVAITSTTLTDAQKQSIKTKVAAAAQAVVDEHLGTA